MTWSETKRRWHIMREIEELFLQDPGAALPWNDELAELFGDRDHLVTALRYRWQLTRQAQLDTDSPEPAWEEQQGRVERRTRTLLRILDRAAAEAQGGHRAVA
ncbi:hypothetical protein [Nocardioides antri]|uniref:Uncharacterized protein n=1 Tax=Nocardioides antri TaxID=2607659 RepID=A0A5B1M0Y5_9ACTN|nr:hypothetical protein [Nocardioides antri]KAA1426815.1 hypothetical protein F0U47_12720 [Nocardioides antri]